MAKTHYISMSKIKEIDTLIATGEEHKFYTWPEWQRVRAQTLYLDQHECQMCKMRGRHSRANIVHHVKHLKARPDLALDIWDGQERQLVSVCKKCHEELHPESMQKIKKQIAPVTQERWD